VTSSVLKGSLTDWLDGGLALVFDFQPEGSGFNPPSVHSLKQEGLT